MNPTDNPHSSARSTFLTFLMLTLLAIGGFVFFLGLFGPFAIAFLVIVGVMCLAGLCHYLMWGRSMSQEVAAEQEDEEGPSAESNGWPDDGPHRPGRF